jgi:C4-dicarboxylate-specific signal transduction histidine kinase
VYGSPVVLPRSLREGSLPWRTCTVLQVWQLFALHPLREKPSSQPVYTGDTEWQESRALTELTHARRIATIELAASIPHEVNLPIAAMVKNAQAAPHLLDCQAMNLEEVRSALASIIRVSAEP